MSNSTQKETQSVSCIRKPDRRKILKYAAPAILTLISTPALASPGSCKSIGGPNYPCVNPGVNPEVNPEENTYGRYLSMWSWLKSALHILWI